MFGKNTIGLKITETAGIQTQTFPGKWQLAICTCHIPDCFDIFIDLKEYYEIIDEARPLSGFYPTHADFFTEMHF